MSDEPTQQSQTPQTQPTQAKTAKIIILITVLILAGLMALFLWLMRPQNEQPSQKEEPGKNAYIDQYMQANWNGDIARQEPFPAQTEPKILRGTWFEMGQQYGQAFGNYVRIVYDANFGLFTRSNLDAGKLGSVLNAYIDETKEFSPEMMEFIRGISVGAENELDSATNAAALSNLHKVMMINCLFEVVLPSAWPHVASMMGGEAPQAAESVAWEPFASHGWAAWGNMTPTGDGIIGGTRDQPWFPTLFNVSYVAIPSDTKAAVTWGNTIAGMVTASSSVNANGVGVANTIVSEKQQEFGVPALISTAHISFFATSAREAADMLTVGTPEYREKTGRQTLASTVGFFQVFADAKEAFAVERTGRNFAIRQEGMANEPGDYLVLPNHAVASDSKDETNKVTGQPMEVWTKPSSPESSSVSRYWALFHELANNVGKIDVPFAEQKIATMKHTYTPDGQKVTEKDGLPVWRLGLTPERWLIPNPSDPTSFPTGGNNMYFVADLKNLDVYWVQGIPSHWEGPWEHVSLRDTAYRR